MIEKIENIEDFKGNPTYQGEMLITNLRLIWYMNKNKTINLSVGYETIIQIQIKINNSKLLG